MTGPSTLTHACASSAPSPRARARSSGARPRRSPAQLRSWRRPRKGRPGARLFGCRPPQIPWYSRYQATKRWTRRGEGRRARRAATRDRGCRRGRERRSGRGDRARLSREPALARRSVSRSSFEVRARREPQGAPAVRRSAATPPGSRSDPARRRSAPRSAGCAPVPIPPRRRDRGAARGRRPRRPPAG